MKVSHFWGKNGLRASFLYLPDNDWLMSAKARKLIELTSAVKSRTETQMLAWTCTQRQELRLLLLEASLVVKAPLCYNWKFYKSVHFKENIRLWATCKPASPFDCKHIDSLQTTMRWRGARVSWRPGIMFGCWSASNHSATDTRRYSVPVSTCVPDLSLLLISFWIHLRGTLCFFISMCRWFLKVTGFRSPVCSSAIM